MNRLQSELQRLYLARDAHDQPADAARPLLIAADGRTRAMVLALAGPDRWERLAKVWQGVQGDLQLPPPGIAISGTDAYQLWFSLAEPVPAAHATAFLSALRRRYLADVAADRIVMVPDAAATGPAGDGARMPPFEATPGCWSAFVAPDLAALFADEPWLDLAPGADAQAELLSRLQSMKATELEHARERLGDLESPAAGLASTAAPATRATAPTHAAAVPAARHQDPRQFLLAVMNDPAVELPLRIEAAKALLPYLER